MEIKTQYQIGIESEKEQFGGVWDKRDKKWIAVDSILDDLEAAIDKGNITIDGRKGFKASLWVSDLKKKLKNNKMK